MLNHWAKKLGRDVRVFSAAPSGRLHPFALEVLTPSTLT
jgi:arsenate reductase